MKASTSNTGNIFVIFVLLFFFMILYSYVDTKEVFSNINRCGGASPVSSLSPNEYMIPSGGSQLFQGIPIPPKYVPSVEDIGKDKDLPPVDGDSNSARSMNMFAFNRCAPECCLESPYSCDRGCVCITPKQYEHLDKRGDNRNASGCTFESRL